MAVCGGDAAPPRPGGRRAPSCWPGSRAAARAGRRSRPRGTTRARQRRDPGARRGRRGSGRASPACAGDPDVHEVIVVDDGSHGRHRGDRARRRARAWCTGRAAAPAGSASRGRSSRGSRRRAATSSSRSTPTRGRGRGWSARSPRRSRDADLVTAGARFTARRAGSAPGDAGHARLPLRPRRRARRRAARLVANGQVHGGAARGAAGRGRLRGGRRAPHRRRRAGAGARPRGLAGRVPRRRARSSTWR